MNILVTGGAGFLGSTFVKYLLETYPNYQVNVLDSIYIGSLSNLSNCYTNPNFQFFLGNVSDTYMTGLLAEYADIIVNFANSKDSSDCIGAQTLATIASSSGARLIHISDYRVYGGYGIHPPKEEDPLNPITINDGIKAASDMIIQSYIEEHGVDGKIIRIPNSFGPFQSADSPIPSIIKAILEGQDISVPNGEYEFMYSKDVCHAIDLVINSNAKSSILNIGSGVRHSMVEVAHMIISLCGASRTKVSVNRVSKPVRFGISSERAIYELGQYDITPIKAALKETVDWYKTRG